MTRLEWDQVGDRKYHAGVDRGVLYLSDVVVPWNGITGVEEVSNAKVQPYFQDGVKYMNQQILGNAEFNLKAFTYPDEFDRCLGLESTGTGISFHDQLGESFGLSYRTLIGDDLTALEHGYVIHVLYNMTAIPSSSSFSTVGQSVTPIEFSWNLTCVPEPVPWLRPTAHISIRSTDIDPTRLQAIEDTLYGWSGSGPYLPSVTEFQNA